MRRVLSVLVLSVILLTGCGKAASPPVTDGFRCAVTLRYDETVYEGTLERQTAQSGTLVLTAPLAVEGLTMTWTGEEVTLSYGGMELKLNEEQLPVGAAIKVMCRALDSCAERVQKEGAAADMSGELAGTPFTMAFDTDNGYPLSLELPSVPLVVTFSAWENYA